VAGRIRSIKKIHLIGTRTRDLSACSIVPQPNTLQRASNIWEDNIKMDLKSVGRLGVYGACLP
jgi:hypothetical protein